MEDWKVVAVIPNIAPSHSIGTSLAAFAPQTDLRIRDAYEAEPRLQDFLSRFTDAFGERLRPAVLMVHRDAPECFRTVEAIAAFRDTVALSAVLFGRALGMRSPFGRQIRYTSAFSLYPWMLDKSGRHLTMYGPALVSAGADVESFQGQSAPDIPVMTLNPWDIDTPLLGALLRRWERRFSTSSPEREDRALFRALNMANHAAKTPAGVDATFYDYGRLIALWVSAFEILTHPPNGDVGLRTIYEVLETVQWQHEDCRTPKHNARPLYRKDSRSKRNLACWLYGRIYNARNAYLHGNPVDQDDLMVNNGRHSLFQYAAPLFRMALTDFLQLYHRSPVPPLDDTERAAAYIIERMTFSRVQDEYESALLTADAM